MITLSLITVFGIGFLLFNEIEDECVRNTWKKNKQFMNTGLSWKNKWELDIRGNIIPTQVKHWYYFGINPKYVERFYLSSTVFVWLTDMEHLSQFIKKRFIDAGFLVIGWDYVVAWIVGTILMQIIKEKFINSIH